MAEIEVASLVAEASDVVRRVEEGAMYLVTRDGRPAAVLMPIRGAEDLVLANSEILARERKLARIAYLQGRSVALDDLE